MDRPRGYHPYQRGSAPAGRGLPPSQSPSQSRGPQQGPPQSSQRYGPPPSAQSHGHGQRYPPSQRYGAHHSAATQSEAPQLEEVRAVTVKTNSFVVKSLPKITYYQNDIIFTPVNLRPDLKVRPDKRQRLIHALQIHHLQQFGGRAVFDGGFILLTTQTLNTSEFLVHDTSQDAPSDSPGWFRIRLSRTVGQEITPSLFRQAICGNAPAALAVIQLLLLQTQSQRQITISNNKKAFFFPDKKQVLNSGGIELWSGYFQAVRPSPGRLLVTVDTTICAMYMSGACFDVAMHVLRTSNTRALSLTNKSRDDRDFRKLVDFFKGRQIRVPRTYGTRVKTIRDLERGPVGHIMFGEGVQKSILQHYHQAHNIRLQYPDSIGVVLSGRSAPFKVIVPLELCEMVPGQPYRKKLPPEAAPTVTRFAVLEPDKRLARITGDTHGVSSPINTYNTSEHLVEAGVSIDTEPLVVRGRILPAPPLKYGCDAVVNPKNGAWNVLDKQFYIPQTINSWAVLVLVPGMQDKRVNNIMWELATCCRNLGMTIPSHVPMEWGGGHGPSVQAKMQKLVEESRNLDIMLVILPEKAEETRRWVKYFGDVMFGVRTQCFKETQLPKDGDRRASQYYNNIALKLNARMGGCNAIVGSPLLLQLYGGNKPFMVVGADVAHAAPGSAHPSIASLVWSHDRRATMYRVVTRLQPARVEMIQDLKAMFRSAYESLGRQYRNTPGHIFFYRDGVSEGEFLQVKEVEIQAINDALDDIWTERKLTDDKPLLTFIVVGKRHHVSFFPKSPTDFAGDRTGNCKPGLAVDEDLRNPLFKDFYLQSHAAIKGTSRSGHYTILQDDNFNEDVDKLEELSYALCHAYAKATRSVSIPAPVYYADLACDHAKYHINPDSRLKLLTDGGSSSESGHSSIHSEASLDEWSRVFGPVHPNLAAGMYFL